MNEEAIGIIGPISWDQKGNVLSIALFTSGEKEYVIANTRGGQELFNQLGKEVRVIFSKNGYFRDQIEIVVHNYTVIDAVS
ncbi:MAG: hypothetical protein HQM14_12205 [SAR324 cluster bacterium]|nr:hypothetical protein [SAR324 cluster bacterium]